VDGTLPHVRPGVSCLTTVSRGRYEDVSSRGQRLDPEHPSGTVRAGQRRGDLAPAKQRIAEALAALLVAHYRRQTASAISPEPRGEHLPVA
jgi:hypothetical protein